MKKSEKFPPESGHLKCHQELEAAALTRDFQTISMSRDAFNFIFCEL
jgi:hypothetical protein